MVIDKQALIKRIQELDSLSNEDKSALIGVLREHKKYGLVWEHKPEEVEEYMKDHLPVLTEVKERAIISSDPKSPNHLIIEGDNLQGLTTLSYTHRGKIDVIYIDPPYNTGSTDWKYNNDYVDGTDSFRHSKWASLMSKRLKIAKVLLKDTGIIVATIDDYEIATLRLLMDEVFGENNYLGTIVIRNNPSGRSTVRGLSVNHEYALLYSASELSMLGRMPHNDEQKSRYKEQDSTGYYEWENFRKNGTDSDRPDRPKQFYPIFVNTDSLSARIPEVVWDDEAKEYILKEECELGEITVYPISDNGSEKVWKYGIERAKSICGSLLVKRNNNGIEIYRKKYLNDSGSLPRTWWDKADYSARDNGTRALTNIFGPQKVFDFPKAPEAVKDSLIAANLGKDGTVLDFFAGSGTTLHATLLLNAEDGGSRKCILVTNNENNICEEVTYERCKRVINGYTKPNGEKVAGIKNNNLRYYKTIFVSREATNKNKRDLVAAATDLLCIKNELYAEQFSFFGHKIKKDAMRFFDDGKQKMLVIFDERAVIPVVDVIRQNDFKGKILIYVFSNSRYAYDDEFIEVSEKVILCALPAAIYEAYKKVLPPIVKQSNDETQNKVDGYPAVEDNTLFQE